MGMCDYDSTMRLSLRRMPERGQRPALSCFAEHTFMPVNILSAEDLFSCQCVQLWVLVEFLSTAD